MTPETVMDQIPPDSPDPDPGSVEVTGVLDAVARGDFLAADRLLPMVYEDLRRLAARRLAAEAPGQTLDATSLVHEAYLRLAGFRPDAPWKARGHFFAAAAEAMRRILIDRARDRKRLKRGGRSRRQDLDLETLARSEGSADDLIDLDEAIEGLAEVDARSASLVKLRLFAGLTLEEAARALGVSPRTADFDWKFARSWLFDRLKESDPG
jgi:RNA polymerase sigma factor (TIGR02999 family)